MLILLLLTRRKWLEIYTLGISESSAMLNYIFPYRRLLVGRQFSVRIYSFVIFSGSHFLCLD